MVDFVYVLQLSTDRLLLLVGIKILTIEIMLESFQSPIIINSPTSEYSN